MLLETTGLDFRVYCTTGNFTILYDDDPSSPPGQPAFGLLVPSKASSLAADTALVPGLSQTATVTVATIASRSDRQDVTTAAAGRLGIGATIGIFVAVFAVLTLGLSAGWFIWRRRGGFRKEDKRAETMNKASPLVSLD